MVISRRRAVAAYNVQQPSTENLHDSDREHTIFGVFDIWFQLSRSFNATRKGVDELVKKKRKIKSRKKNSIF